MRRILQPHLVIDTAERLKRRIEERFPGSGLSAVCADAVRLAREAEGASERISQPHIPLRVAAWFLGVTLTLGVPAAFLQARTSPAFGSVAELLQGVEAAANLTLLLGAAILSLLKLEEASKRRKALALTYQLKALSHVVDMHQLSKNPEAQCGPLPATASSPTRSMTPGELSRYLDYCSELLSVIGKVAAIYAQSIQDPVVLEEVDGIEDLTTSLSRKVWQKIAILQGASGIAPKA